VVLSEAEEEDRADDYSDDGYFDEEDFGAGVPVGRISGLLLLLIGLRWQRLRLQRRRLVLVLRILVLVLALVVIVITADNHVTKKRGDGLLMTLECCNRMGWRWRSQIISSG